MGQIQGTNKNDTLSGTAGVDKIYGYDGDDIIYAKDGDDEAYGGAGNDTLYGGEGNDRLGGGTGDDIIYGGTGNDILYGGEGSDILYGGTGDDTLYGNIGNDIIYGGEGSDILYGGTGDDLLIGGAGADTFYGGDGIDTVSYETYTTDDAYNRGVTVYLDNEDYYSYNGDSKGDVFYSIENVKGSIYDDVIYGDSGDNIIWGNGGNDYLIGYSERLFSQTRDYSYLFGNDTFYTGSKAGDSVYIDIGFGNNTVYGGDGNEYINQQLIGLNDITEDMVFGKNIFNLGEGNNSVYVYCNPISTDITSGDGGSFINVLNPDWDSLVAYYSNLVFGTTNIEVGNGYNYIEVNNNFGDVNVITGSSGDNITLRNDNSYGSSDIFFNLLGSVLIDAGAGDNSITLGYITNATITAGDGNDEVRVSNVHQNTGIKVPVKSIYIDLGEGNNYVNLGEVFGNTNVVTGAGDDKIGIYESSDINVDAGAGNNLFELFYISKASITAGDGNDHFYISNESWNTDAILPAENIYADLGDGDNVVDLNYIRGNVNIVTGAGDDIFNAEGVAGSNINAGAGNDKIVIDPSNCNEIYITGGQGSDTYEANIYNNAISNTSNIINNYDTDGGFDILKLTDSNLDSYSAIFKDNDLIISHSDPHNNGIENTLVVENYTLGSDYQIDQFNIGGAEYTSDQFLAEMGLSL